MNHTTQIDNLKLSPWYYAVLAAKAVMQQKITEMEQAGIVSSARAKYAQADSPAARSVTRALERNTNALMGTASGLWVGPEGIRAGRQPGSASREVPHIWHCCANQTPFPGR